MQTTELKLSISVHDVLFVLIVCENSIETSLYLPLIKYARKSHIG